MQKDDKRFFITALEMAFTISFNFAAAVFVGVWGGRALDERTGASPWFAILGGILGTIAGFWSIYKRVAGFRKK